MAIGCFLDVRCLILGLMVCLAILPSIAFFLFVHRMFASEIVANLLPHTIERHPSSRLLRIFRPADKDDPAEAEMSWIESGRITLLDSNIVKTKTSSEYVIIFFKDSPMEVLYVPKY